MAERNCKKCFHYNACKEVASHSGYTDINYTESQCENFICADADVNRLKQISNALTPEYLEYTKYQKWDGKLPTYTNGTTYFKVED